MTGDGSANLVQMPNQASVAPTKFSAGLFEEREDSLDVSINGEQDPLYCCRTALAEGVSLKIDPTLISCDQKGFCSSWVLQRAVAVLGRLLVAGFFSNRGSNRQQSRQVEAPVADRRWCWWCISWTAIAWADPQIFAAVLEDLTLFGDSARKYRAVYLRGTVG